MASNNVSKVRIPVNLLDENIGQIDGLPTNPRGITQRNFELLKSNIKNYPELLDYNPLKVYPLNGRYVVIGGNMRLRALREIGRDEVTCVVLDEKTDAEKLKAYSILDNASFGTWDLDKLGGWDENELPQWGLDLPTYDEEALDEFFVDEEKDEKRRLTVCVPSSLADMAKVIREEVELLVIKYDGVKVL